MHLVRRSEAILTAPEQQSILIKPHDILSVTLRLKLRRAFQSINAPPPQTLNQILSARF
jgi:hypothetical protein